MNGTDSKIDTPVARDGSRFELIGRDGEKHGPFATIGEARRKAHDLWPLQTQDEERTEGWDIQVVGSDQ